MQHTNDENTGLKKLKNNRKMIVALKLKSRNSVGKHSILSEPDIVQGCFKPSSMIMNNHGACAAAESSDKFYSLC